jgi:hypothetical protein
MNEEALAHWRGVAPKERQRAIQPYGFWGGPSGILKSFSPGLSLFALSSPPMFHIHISLNYGRRHISVAIDSVVKQTVVRLQTSACVTTTLGSEPPAPITQISAETISEQ